MPASRAVPAATHVTPRPASPPQRPLSPEEALAQAAEVRAGLGMSAAQKERRSRAQAELEQMRADLGRAKASDDDTSPEDGETPSKDDGKPWRKRRL